MKTKKNIDIQSIEVSRRSIGLFILTTSGIMMAKPFCGPGQVYPVSIVEADHYELINEMGNKNEI